MKRLLQLLCILVMLTIASCSGDNTVSGYVVGKKHSPAHTTRSYNPTTHHHTTHHYPESWTLWVADSTAVRTVHVDKSTFDSAVKGESIRLRCGKESND